MKNFFILLIKKSIYVRRLFVAFLCLKNLPMIFMSSTRAARLIFSFKIQATWKCITLEDDKWLQQSFSHTDG